MAEGKGKLELTGGCDHPVPPVAGSGAEHSLGAPFNTPATTGSLPNVITVDIGKKGDGNAVSKT